MRFLERSVGLDRRNVVSLAAAAIGTALPTAGLAFVLVSRPRELTVGSDVVYGSAWLLFAAFLVPAVVAAALGLYAVARRRLGWTLSAAVALLLLAAWFAAGPAESIGWLRIVGWAPPILLFAAALLAQGRRTGRSAGPPSPDTNGAPTGAP